MPIRRTGLRITGVDAYVAEGIRSRRLVVGLTMKETAGKLGISPHQLTKYERAVDRISAAKLYAIACLLEVTVDSFFEGIGLYRTTGPTNDLSWQALTPPRGLGQQHIDSLVIAYWRIRNPKARQGVLDLIQTMAAKSDETALEGGRANIGAQ